jgi:hypothetical protein
MKTFACVLMIGLASAKTVDGISSDIGLKCQPGKGMSCEIAQCRLSESLVKKHVPQVPKRLYIKFLKNDGNSISLEAVLQTDRLRTPDGLGLGRYIETSEHFDLDLDLVDVRPTSEGEGGFQAISKFTKQQENQIVLAPIFPETGTRRFHSILTLRPTETHLGRHPSETRFPIDCIYNSGS